AGDPALALALQERRHAVLDAHGADHPGVTHLDQGRALGVLAVAGRDLDRPDLVRGPSVLAHAPPLAPEERRIDLPLEVPDPEAHRAALARPLPGFKAY